MSIVPLIVPEEDLQTGNSITQGSSSLIGFIGPALAGGLIASFADEKVGMGMAIGIDAMTFVVSVITLWKMHSGEIVRRSNVKSQPVKLFKSIKDGFGYMLKDPVLRMMLFLIALANLCFTGPLLVGIPYLADTRFTGGAATYEIILSGFAGGNLLGIILSGILPKLTKRIVRGIMIAMFAAFGLGIFGMSWISNVWIATADLFILGALEGYLFLLMITSLQRTTPKVLLGRLMSMILLANLCMTPLSQSLSGLAMRWSVVSVFATAGLIMIVTSMTMAFSRTTDLMSDVLIGGRNQ